jgi:signal recognition particle subunit SRP54
MLRQFVRKPYDFDEFRRQIDQMWRARRFQSRLRILPWLRRLAQLDRSWISEAEERRVAGIIDSMTPEERKSPYLIDIPGRRRRVALGAGVDPSEVLWVVERFDTMAAFTRQFESMGIVDRFQFFARAFRQELAILCRKPTDGPSST